MRTITLFILVLTVQHILAQSRLVAKDGQIVFEASVPLFEPVKAINKEVLVVFDSKTKILICVALVADFDFELDLMKKHFNENYLESNHYPKAIFKGKIEEFDLDRSSELPKEYIISGKIHLRGVTKLLSVKSIIQKTADGLLINATFDLNPDDFKIEIPKTVSNKIAKIVTTNLVANLE